MSTDTHGVTGSVTSVTTIGYIARKPGSVAPKEYQKRAVAAAEAGIRLVQLACTELTSVQGRPVTKVYHWNGASLVTGYQALPLSVIDHSDRKIPKKHKRFIDHLARHGVRFVTPRNTRLRLSSKWRQYKYLKSGGVNMPETALLSMETLELFAERYPLLFIKPRVASHGNGQFVIKKHRDCSYTVTRSGQSKAVHFASKGPMLTYIEEHTGVQRNERNYVVQVGIDVAKIRGRVFDFRAIIQRNEQGMPVMSACYLRVGRPRSFQANIHKQGHPLDPALTLPGWGELRRRVYKIAKAAFLSCGDIAEAGVDLVMNKKGKLYCLEINTRPGVRGIEMLCQWVNGDPAHKPLKVAVHHSPTNRDRMRWGARLQAYYSNPTLYASHLVEKNK